MNEFVKTVIRITLVDISEALALGIVGRLHDEEMADDEEQHH